jgi:hypothetical protein
MTMPCRRLMAVAVDGAMGVVVMPFVLLFHVGGVVDGSLYVVVTLPCSPPDVQEV